MNLLNAQQIKDWDAYTIRHEPISAIDLTERASACFVQAFIKYMSEVSHLYKNNPVYIFCGPGNNGSDGFAIARMLIEEEWNVIVCMIPGKRSACNQINYDRLKQNNKRIITEINRENASALLPENCIIIDALFGTGLNKPVNGVAALLINSLNAQKGYRIAIDMPSGLSADLISFDGLAANVIFKADYTFTFQLPKQSFMFPETYLFIGDYEVLQIGLHPGFLNEVIGDTFLITTEWAHQQFKKKNRFVHKGTKGHALIVAGSYGKMGASLLASKAALRAGCGLVTAYVPKTGYTILQTAFPEAMVQTDEALCEISNFPLIDKFDAIGVGPGMGIHPYTVKAFGSWLNQINLPILIDADALNACAALLKINDKFTFPCNAVLTPHPKEFERLAGKSKDSLERLKRQKEFAAQYQVIVVLKGANTSITMPDGRTYFNTTGNALLATAGSGDVLSGMITSLLAQGYNPEVAAMLGVYLHGTLGDRLKQKGLNNIIAGDLVEELKFV